MGNQKIICFFGILIGILYPIYFYLLFETTNQTSIFCFSNIGATGVASTVLLVPELAGEPSRPPARGTQSHSAWPAWSSSTR